MTDWTIGDELRRMGRHSDLAVAMMHLGLIDRASNDYSITELAPWRRSGAETYAYEFRVTSEIRTQHVILKACVGFGPSTTLERIFNDWLARRALLQSHGICTPRLFGSGEAVVLEEFIQWNVWHYIHLYPAELTARLIDIAHVAGTLARLRFAPVDVFNDLRTRGFDTVVIDFGEDLGPPNIASDVNSDLLHQFRRFLANANLKLDRETVEAVEATFADALIEPT